MPSAGGALLIWSAVPKLVIDDDALILTHQMQAEVRQKGEHTYSKVWWENVNVDIYCAL